MNVLIVNDGETLRGYDCRDVLSVEELPSRDEDARGERFLVHLGRQGARRELRCREVLGFFPLSARDVRPLPAALRERLGGDVPWGIGLTDRGVCLLF